MMKGNKRKGVFKQMGSLLVDNIAKEHVLRLTISSAFCIHSYICSRVNSCVKSGEHVLEELETEGERQLKSLLQHQLDTSVSIEE